jgi:hypothetical protein
VRPIAQADGHDGPRLVNELVPGKATVLEDLTVGAKDAVGEPVVALNCQTFPTGLSSGHLGGSGKSVMFDELETRMAAQEAHWGDPRFQVHWMLTALELYDGGR